MTFSGVSALNYLLQCVFVRQGCDRINKNPMWSYWPLQVWLRCVRDGTYEFFVDTATASIVSELESMIGRNSFSRLLIRWFCVTTHLAGQVTMYAEATYISIRRDK